MPGHYDLWTVLLSFFIASLSGFVSFEAVDHTRYGTHKGRWRFMGGLTLGLGIWSMHFVGMLAWHPPFPLYYQLLPTCVSVLVAIGASWLALHLVVRTTSTTPALFRFLGALVVGGGICAMHYMGMEALRFDRPSMWSPIWVVASLVVAVSASWIAMALLVRSLKEPFGLANQLYGSLLIGAAICGMHYTGMHAMMLGSDSVCLAMPGSFTGPSLGRVGVANALLFAICLLVVSYHDRSHWLRLANDARFQAQEASRNADRLAAAAKIAATVAHEINNPVAAMTNLLYLIGEGEIGKTERGYLDLAQQELKRIGEITTHTLKFHRQQSKPELTFIPDLLESAIALFQSRIDTAAIEVKGSWSPDVQPILCMAGEIRQVLANLVSNAVDAMYAGGTLTLSVEEVSDGLRIEVADSGAGIPLEVQERILEPFFTTKGPAGTGLGLSISLEIIARHEGTLTFVSSTSKGDSGSKFVVHLPSTLQARNATAEETLQTSL